MKFTETQQNEIIATCYKVFKYNDYDTEKTLNFIHNAINENFVSEKAKAVYEFFANIVKVISKTAVYK